MSTSSLQSLPQRYDAQAAASSIRARLPPQLQYPKIGIICGSGLAGLADSLLERVDLPYSQIEGFEVTTVAGHMSALAFGLLKRGDDDATPVPIVCQLGRFHAYEGYNLQSVVFPVRVMKALGAQGVIITNAAGGMAERLSVGDIVVLHDHVSLPSLTAMNPLIGPNIDSVGPRFPSMSDAYDFNLRKLAFRACRDLGMPKGTLKEGTYAWVSGPTYETRAECRLLRSMGADVVGMSTVPEVIAAHHCGLRVLVLSLVTNKVIDDAYRSAEAEVDAEIEGNVAHTNVKEVEAAATHQEVLQVSLNRAKDMKKLVWRIMETW